MEEPETMALESLFEKVKNYGDTTVELYKLKAVEKTATLLSSIIVFGMMFIVVIFFLLMLNIGFALLLGELFGKNYYGFFAMAAFVAFLIGFVYTSRRPLIKEPIVNFLIRLTLK